MTYCLGMRLAAGLVFVSDSRTNAGVDSVATFRKCFVFDEAEDRAIVVLTAGNLAVTQAVIALLEDRAASQDAAVSIYAATSMFEVARIVGDAVREIDARDGEHLQKHGSEFNASFIVGGQIAGRRVRLYHLYSAGNFIEATEETPFFQIGETKYGKPIIERVLTYDTALIKAAKCALVSFDSTIKSNLSVAPPLDMVIIPADRPKDLRKYRIGDSDTYFRNIRTLWGEGLNQVFTTLPDPDWLDPTL